MFFSFGSLRPVRTYLNIELECFVLKVHKFQFESKQNILIQYWAQYWGSKSLSKWAFNIEYNIKWYRLVYCIEENICEKQSSLPVPYFAWQKVAQIVKYWIEEIRSLRMAKNLGWMQHSVFAKHFSSPWKKENFLELRWHKIKVKETEKLQSKGRRVRILSRVLATRRDLSPCNSGEKSAWMSKRGTSIFQVVMGVRDTHPSMLQRTRIDYYTECLLSILNYHEFNPSLY